MKKGTNAEKSRKRRDLRRNPVVIHKPKRPKGKGKEDREKKRLTIKREEKTT